MMSSSAAISFLLIYTISYQSSKEIQNYFVIAYYNNHELFLGVQSLTCELRNQAPLFSLAIL